jgi:hypothetical protein
MKDMRKLRYLPLLKITHSMRAMSTNVIEWLIIIRLVRDHERTQKVMVTHVEFKYQEFQLALVKIFSKNDCKGTSLSIHLKRKTKSTN